MIVKIFIPEKLLPYGNTVWAYSPWKARTDLFALGCTTVFSRYLEGMMVVSGALEDGDE